MPILLLSLLACRSEPEPIPFCAGPTEQRWAPGEDGDELMQYPDDALTVADPESPTGLRPRLPSAWLDGLPELLRGLPAPVEQRSGFGRMGAIILRFTDPLGALPDGWQASLDSEALMLVDLDAGERRPFQATLGDRGRQLQVQPLRPLRAGARHALVLTDAHLADDGGCVAPSPALAALLSGEGEDPTLIDRYAALPEQLGLAPERISAATVFTTHDDLREIADIAAGFPGAELAWDAPMSCEPWGEGRACTGSFVAVDHRGEGRLVDPEGAGTYTLLVSAWLPNTPDAPVVLYGHGIDSSRWEGRWLASRVLEDGVAVVSVDALEHGDHPSAQDDDDLDAAAFLGISLSPLGVDGQALAQNFVQTNLDRLQLAALLRAAPDLDGDGEADIDPTRLAYVGVSLGGLLAPSFGALEPEVELVALPLGGGHLATFATQNGFVAALQGAFIELLGDEAEWELTLAVAQGAIDAADPATWADHVLDDSLHGRETPPHLYFPVSTWDEIVPVATGEALARALEIPHVPPAVYAVEGLPLAPAAPVSGNLDGVTAGFFQFDRVTVDGEVLPSAHDQLMSEPEGSLQLLHVMQTWVESGVPEILDPYAELNTPTLP
ncbi:MAG: hypothetical protein H6741_34195 [Alphaproteobacteria bacterium]|nr:hypothetical protein [Alphaproteobacteria bacterium]